MSSFAQGGLLPPTISSSYHTHWAVPVPTYSLTPPPADKEISCEDVAAALDAAREAIEQRGWVQGALSSPDGVCALGALHAGRLRWSESVEFQRYLEQEYATRAALQRYLEQAGRLVNPQLNSIAAWNDDPARTREDVLLAFKQAAAWVRERAGQAP